jgi:hypothetical protein
MAKIEEKYRQKMNLLGRVLDETFNPPGRPKKAAFVLLLAEFGDIKGGRVNYISNGDRADIISMLHEILARFEGRASFDEPPSEVKQ